MKNTIKLASLLLSFLFLFSSCQAVYDVELTAPETTTNPEIDLTEEYYTTGMPYHTGDVYEGMIYEGCLIYIETVTTVGVVSEKISAEGEKTPIYGDIQIDRLVKYNPVTGIISSPCLNPTCNHSLESECPMLLGLGDRARENYVLLGIFGDWLIYRIHKMDDEYSTLSTEIMYNLKSGEYRNVFVDDLGGEEIARWNSGVYFEGKFYKVYSVMDYSNTGYKPGSGQKLSDFQPVTRQYLYEYDFDTNVSKELYEIKSDWSLGKVSNLRFYFRDSNKKYFSIKKDGSDEKEDPEVASSNQVGTYTIYYTSNGYTIHDLKTNELSEVAFDHSILGCVCVTDKGILTASQTKYDEWKNFDIQQYQQEHPGASRTEASNAKKKLLSTGAAQIWQCDYTGENNHVIFELSAARIKIITAYGDYIFAKVSKFDTETGANLEDFSDKTCCINIVTGEVTPIPELDIVVPYWYVN